MGAIDCHGQSTTDEDQRIFGPRNSRKPQTQGNSLNQITLMFGKKIVIRGQDGGWRSDSECMEDMKMAASAASTRSNSADRSCYNGPRNTCNRRKGMSDLVVLVVTGIES